MSEPIKKQTLRVLRDEEYDPAEVLDDAPILSADEERERAKAWLRTAAQHLRNEVYWEKRAIDAEKRSQELIEALQRATRWTK